MYDVVVIGKQTTLVIPRAIREQLSPKEGQRVLLRVEDGRLVIEPLPLSQDTYVVLKHVIGESYAEDTDEPKAEAWLKRHAGY